MGHRVVILNSDWQSHEGDGGAVGKSRKTFILGAFLIVPVLKYEQVSYKDMNFPLLLIE